MEVFGSNILEVEEWDLRSLRRIESRYDTLALNNRAGTQVDESALAETLSQVSGRERITSLVVEASSKLRNLAFLRALPRLQAINAYGLHLQTLDGLESFQSGRYLKIDTDRNRKRAIDKIAITPITGLDLAWARAEDLEAIAQSRTINRVSLFNCPPLPLDRWQNVPIEVMGLWNGRIDRLSDTGQLGLRTLTLNDCRHFERFEGDNGTITWGFIQFCNRLDWQTIKTVRRLESLTIAGSKSDIPLSAFTGLRELRELSFMQCKVDLDVMDLKSSAEKLEKIHVGGLKKDQLVELSQANEGVLVTSGKLSLLNGIPA